MIHAPHRYLHALRQVNAKYPVSRLLPWAPMSAMLGCGLSAVESLARSRDDAAVNHWRSSGPSAAGVDKSPVTSHLHLETLQWSHGCHSQPSTFLSLSLSPISTVEPYSVPCVIP